MLILMKLHYIWSMVWSFWRQLHWSLRLQAWRTQIYQVSNAYNFLIFSLYNTYKKKKKKFSLYNIRLKTICFFILLKRFNVLILLSVCFQVMTPMLMQFLYVFSNPLSCSSLFVLIPWLVSDVCFNVILKFWFMACPLLDIWQAL